MQLAFDQADRLVELLQARRGPVAAPTAAKELYALAHAPTAIARSLLEDVVGGDARLEWRGDAVALAGSAGLDRPLEEASFVVVDLETTGLSPRHDRICEIGAQRVRALELDDAFESLVDPGVPLPASVAALTGIDSRLLAGAPRVEHAVRGLLEFAGGDVVVAHNARFDVAFLDREVERLTGRRIVSPVVDTVWLARRLLGHRTRRVGLASLAWFLGVATEPCHRALPDARATAEVLLHLIGLAQERGARSVGDLVELAAPRARRLHAKRSLVAGAPVRPGVYVFRGSNGQALYVGRARNLRQRLRSYFAGSRQRPALEAALAALERVEWRELGSELEAALEELRLLRELRPPANARSVRPGRHLYLSGDTGRWRVTEEPTRWGPLRGRRSAQLAARALDGHEGDDPADALPALHRRLLRLSAEQRYEDAARLRDRVAALDAVVERLAELERLRSLRVCLLVPAREPGTRRAFFVVGGRVAAVRTLPPGGGAHVELRAGLAIAREAECVSPGPEDLEEVGLVASFLRRPPPELEVIPLDRVPAVAFAA